MTRRMNSARANAACFFNRRGQIMLITGMALPILLGFLGLAIDVGHFYHIKRRMQFAADAGSVGGAWEIWRNNPGRITQAGREDAKRNGFDDAAPDIIVDVNHPPTSGPHTDDPKFVEVIVTRDLPTYFLRVVNQNSTTIRARAVAGIMTAAPDVCVLVLDPTKRGALTVEGTAVLNAGCGVMANSDNDRGILVNGTGCILADPAGIGVTGSWVANGSANCTYPPPVADVWPMLDPLATMIPPPISGSGVTVYPDPKISGGVVTLNPGRYDKGITISGGIVTFNPGIYVLNSGMKISGNSIVRGIDVMFYNTNDGTQKWDDIDIAGTVLVDLRAPSSGYYTGILMWNDAACPDMNPGSVISGMVGSRLDGVLYFPTTSVVYTGTSSLADWTMIISNTLKISGTTGINSNFAGSPIAPPAVKVTLVE